MSATPQPDDNNSYEITTKAVKLAAGQFDLESVRILNFASFGSISKIQNLKECKHLEALDLSHNLITKIEGLDMLLLLKRLYLSDNMIASLQGIENLKQLEILHVQNNKIEMIAELDMLKQLPRLRDLNMKGNIVAQESNYFALVTNNAKKLVLLDGAHVLLQVPAISEQACATLQGETIYEKQGDWIAQAPTQVIHPFDTSHFDTMASEGRKLLARADSLLDSL